MKFELEENCGTLVPRLILIKGIDVHFFIISGPEIPFFEKIGLKLSNCYEFLFKLFNLIMSSFCFGKLVKIPENVSDLQGYLLKQVDIAVQSQRLEVKWFSCFHFIQCKTIFPFFL